MKPNKPIWFYCILTAIFLSPNLLGLVSSAQLTAVETASMAQPQSSTVPLASPPGFAPVHLLAFYQPRYTVVTPTLFNISGSNGPNTPSNNPVPKGRAVSTATPQYQPLPTSAANQQYKPLPASAGNTQHSYRTLPMLPRSNAPLPGSNVKIPAPIAIKGQQSNYDIATPGKNKLKPLAGSKVPLPKPLNNKGTQPVNANAALNKQSNIGNNRPLPSVPKNSIPATLQTVVIPRPQVTGGGQRSNGSSSTPGSVAANNTGKYVSSPPTADNSIKHQYDKVPGISKGYQSATKTPSTSGSATYQTLPLRKDGYESATKPLSSSGTQPVIASAASSNFGNSKPSPPVPNKIIQTNRPLPPPPGSSSTYQTLPLKKDGYESATKPLNNSGTLTGSSKNIGNNRPLPPVPKNNVASTQPLPSTSSGNSNYQTLSLNKGGYESATNPISPASTGNKTIPVKTPQYDKVTTPAGYDNAPSPLKNYQSVTSPLSTGASGRTTAAQTTVINDYKPKVPVPSNVQPMSNPGTGNYVSAPKTIAGSSSKTGTTEFKKGALTQGSNTRGALQISKATQDKIKADKAKEAAKQKAAKQKKAAIIRSKKG